LANFYSKEENRAGLRETLRREKALDLLLERAQKEENESASAPQAEGSGGTSEGGTGTQSGEIGSGSGEPE
jgi:hypothetical protein